MDLSNPDCTQFYKILTSPQEERLLIPPRFVKYGFGPVPARVMWVTPDDEEWEVSLFKESGRFYFGRGWTLVRDAYGLSHHDLLAFEYDGGIRLFVSIYDVDGVQKDLVRCLRNKMATGKESNLTRRQVELQHVGGSLMSKKGVLKGRSVKRVRFESSVPVELGGRCEVIRLDEHTQPPTTLYTAGGSISISMKGPAVNKYSLTKQSICMDAYEAARGHGFCMGGLGGPFGTRGVLPNDATGQSPFTLVKITSSSCLLNKPLMVKLSFAGRFLHKGGWEIRLQLSNGRSNAVTCFIGPHKAYLATGWLQFVKDNQLKEGDSCLLMHGESHDIWDATPLKRKYW